MTAKGESPCPIEGNRIFLVRKLVFEYSSQLHENFIGQGELVGYGGGIFLLHEISQARVSCLDISHGSIECLKA